MKVIIYARQSGGDEEQSASVEQQLENCAALAAKEGFEVIGSFFDCNISGKTYPDLEDAHTLSGIDSVYQAWKASVVRKDITARYRKGLAAVFQALSEADYVLVDDTTRLMRPLIGSFLESYIKQKFIDGNVQIRSVKNGTVDFKTFNSSFITSIEGQINDNQLRIQREKSKSALKKLKDSGYFPSGQKRYGYLHLGHHCWEKNEREAKIIRFCFQQIIAMRPYTQIAREVNARFSPDKIFNSTTIKNFTHNYYFCGYQLNSRSELIRCKETEGKEIISYDTFMEAKRIVEQLRKPVSRDKKNINVFAGILKCKYCGKQLVLHTNGPYTQFFSCKTADVSQKTNCGTVNIPYKFRTMNQMGLYEGLAPLLLISMQQEIKTVLERLRQAQNLDSYKIELENILTQEKKIARMYAEGKIDDAQLELLFSTKKERKQELKAIISSAEASNLTAWLDENQDMLEGWSLHQDLTDIFFRSLPPERYKKMLLLYVKRIIVGRDEIEVQTVQGNFVLKRYRQGYRSNTLPSWHMFTELKEEDNRESWRRVENVEETPPELDGQPIETYFYEKKPRKSHPFHMDGDTKFMISYGYESVYTSDDSVTPIFSSGNIEICAEGHQFEDVRGRYSEEHLKWIIKTKKRLRWNWARIDREFHGSFREAACRYGVIPSAKKRKVIRDKRLQ